MTRRANRTRVIGSVLATALVAAITAWVLTNGDPADTRAVDKPATPTAPEFQSTPKIPAPDLEIIEVKGTGQPPEVGEGFEQDAAQYSSQKGNPTITGEELAAEAEFSGVAGDIEGAHPKDFVTAGINRDSTKDFDYYLHLVNRPSADVLDQLAGISGTTEVRVGGLALDHDTQTAASSAALTALRTFPVVVPAVGSAGLNDNASGIRVEFALTEQISEAELTEILDVLTAAARTASGLPDLQLELQEVPPATNELPEN